MRSASALQDRPRRRWPRACFETGPGALQSMACWPAGLGVEAAAMESTGVCWIAPCRAVEEAGMRAGLLDARHVKRIEGRGTDIAWSMLKRTHKGTFRRISPKRLDRCLQEFAGRHSVRNRDAIDRMKSGRNGMDRRRLTYETPIRDNGLPSGARS